MDQIAHHVPIVMEMDSVKEMVLEKVTENVTVMLAIKMMIV